MNLEYQNVQIPCLCHHTNWNGTYASIGEKASYGYVCGSCKRPAVLVIANGYHIFLINKVGSEWPDNAAKWINVTLDTLIRVKMDRLNKVREEIDSLITKCLFVALGITEGVKKSDWTEEQRNSFGGAYKLVHESDFWSKPEFVGKQELPAQLSRELVAYIPNDDGKFYRVNHAACEELKIPKDPIRIKHDEIFDEVFSTLEKQFGQIRKTTTINEYCGSPHEPWYKFSIGDISFLVGPRKRVYSIQADIPKGMSVASIKSLAEADGTSYWADKSWQSDKTNPENIEIHAWGKEKLIEYLTLLGNLTVEVSVG